jgi:hypothetical protein
MAAIDLNSFLHSLIIYMVITAAAQTPAVTIQYKGQSDPPWNVFRNRAVEPDPNNANASALADPYSVLRIYGGPANQSDPTTRRLIQCLTTSPTSEDAALQRSQVLFETLHYPPTDPFMPMRPLRNLYVPAYAAGVFNASSGQFKVTSIDPKQPPGKVGIDPRSRPMIVFNFEAGFVFVPPA